VSGICVRWHREMDLDQTDLIRFLKAFGDFLPDPLSQRTNLEVYADKLHKQADIAYSIVDDEIVGFLAMYANDQVARCAHVVILSLLPSHQGRGIGHVMMSRAIALARQRSMQEIQLNVQKVNRKAQKFYTSMGFIRAQELNERWSMVCGLSALREKAHITPLEEHPRLSDSFGLDIDLRIKRDDLYPMSGGGSKARKIEYIMRDLIANGHDVLVTNGGPQSNHARASALLSAQLGIKCHLVIVLEPGRQYIDSGNFMLMRLSGATIEFCRKEQLADRMNSAMELYIKKGHCPSYVWGGGHCVAGSRAFVDAAVEVRGQSGGWSPDFLIVASGTGTTQAGLSIGFSSESTRVIGISVSRDAARGAQVVLDSTIELLGHSNSLGLSPDKINIDFRDDWVDGGYEETSPELIDTVERAARAGVLVDTTYSGKALRGLVALVRSGEIPKGSRVLFWHTGGLMNLQASSFAGGNISL
jgi:D-cysteine desulfhydrase